MFRTKTIKTPSAALKLLQSLCAKRDGSVFKSRFYAKATPLVTPQMWFNPAEGKTPALRA